MPSSVSTMPNATPAPNSTIAAPYIAKVDRMEKPPSPHDTILVTQAMLEAGMEVLWRYDPSAEGAEAVVKRLLEDMLGERVRFPSGS